MKGNPAVAPLASSMSPLRTRLSQLASLDATELQSLQSGELDPHSWAARREIIAEGDRISAPRALLKGWAYRHRTLSDGRRQILGFLLPGDLIGMYRHRNPVSSTSISAVTDVVTYPIPAAGALSDGLSEALAVSDALEEHYLLAHIIRLGRLSAQERLIDWFLEAHTRLALAGLASDDQFTVPLTQELLADTLGLTSVHVNRTLQALRRDGLLTSKGGMVSFADRGRLESMVHYKRARVSSNR